jgi:glycosyltransferase involved in cell wall biosynthesis
VTFVLNFLPLKSGGGVQVGLDFIAQAKRLAQDRQWYLVASAGTPLAQVRETENMRMLKIVPPGVRARLWFEFNGCRPLVKALKPAAIYTQFGPQWPGATGAASVVGCAYSNLCYPEVDFWRRLPAAQRTFRELVDVGRRRRLQQADAVIFETEDLAERGVRHLQLDRRRVHVVRPSVSSLVTGEGHHADTAERALQIPGGFRVLLLSVYNPNKNFELLPRIAHALCKHAGDRDTIFVLTLPHEAPQLRAILRLATQLQVENRLYNFGPVPHAGCADLYRACDAVILPSQLESFSNSIAESWTMGKPLLISDLPWARSLCGRGAIYFRYDDPLEAAARITELRADMAYRESAVQAGYLQLASYPSSERRFLQYLEILERYAKR